MVNNLNQNIAIIGCGYVGMSLAVLLSQHHKVTLIDIDNEKVKKVLDEIFKPEVLHRKSQQKFSTGHTVAQKYALKELRLCYAILNEEDGELKKQVAKLEVAFNRPLTAAIRKRLNVIRRNGVTGKNLLPLLTDLFIEYEMENHSAFELKFKKEQETDELPRIICSEAIL